MEFLDENLVLSGGVQSALEKEMARYAPISPADTPSLSFADMAPWFFLDMCTMLAMCEKTNKLHGLVEYVNDFGLNAFLQLLISFEAGVIQDVDGCMESTAAQRMHFDKQFESFKGLPIPLPSDIHCPTFVQRGAIMLPIITAIFSEKGKTDIAENYFACAEQFGLGNAYVTLLNVTIGSLINTLPIADSH
ncbi:MAG: hypothetical protein GJ680_07610 [Alteromonadaceae bacterium]|nr:hypothetical protein [Alteromonadaceae bacterium]